MDFFLGVQLHFTINLKYFPNLNLVNDIIFVPLVYNMYPSLSKLRELWYMRIFSRLSQTDTCHEAVLSTIHTASCITKLRI